MSSIDAASPRVLDLAAKTDRGIERRGNEDSYVATEGDGCAVLAVCDGMGGALAGEVASAAAAEVIQGAFLFPAREPAALARCLLASVEDASRHVFLLSREHASYAGMGTTTTACVLSGGDLFLAQVGDSRAYLLRDGALTQLTRDQTLATLLIEQGQLQPEDLDTFEYRNIILQAVGTQERVEVDLRHVPVGRGDVLLVCSDGLHGVVDEARIRDVLDAAPSAEAACEALVDAANAAGGPDNITCVVARVVAGSPPRGAAIATKAVLEPEEPPDTDPLPVGEAPGDDDTAQGVLSRLAAIFRRRRKTLA